MLCQIATSMVHGLEEKFADRMAFEVVDYSTPENQAKIEEYGLDQHGMVITDQDGNLVWSESGHSQKETEVTAQIEAALGG